MINFKLFAYNMRANYKIWTIFLAILLFYGLIIVFMLDTVISDKTTMMTNSAPELMSAFGINTEPATYAEAIVSLLYGFIFIMWPLVYLIAVGHRVSAKMIDRGSMASILASPNSRGIIILTQAVFYVFSLFSLLALSVLALFITSSVIYPGELDALQFIYLNLGLFSLHFLISAICFVVSSSVNESWAYFTFGAGLPIMFYLFQMLGNIGGDLKFFSNLTIFSLFEPEKYLASDWSLVLPQGLTLLGLGILLYLVSFMIFRKRDIAV